MPGDAVTNLREKASVDPLHDPVTWNGINYADFSLF